MKSLAISILLVIAVPLYSQDSNHVSPFVQIESIDHIQNRTFIGFTINGIPDGIQYLTYRLLDADQNYLYTGKFEGTRKELYDEVMVYDPGTYCISVFDKHDSLICKSPPIVVKY